MLEKEFNFYVNNQQSLVKKFRGKFIVLKGTKIIGKYSSEEEAYKSTIKEHDPGSFFIQKCMPGKENYSLSFISRAVF